MSKLSILVKNIEVFEKLSLYGNKTSFLKKISQNSTYLDRMQSGAQLALQYLHSFGEKTRNRAALDAGINKLEPLLHGVDKLTLEQAHPIMTAVKETEKRLASDPETAPFLKEFSPIVLRMEQNYRSANYSASTTELPIDNSPSSISVHDLPNAKVKAKTPISTEVQKALNYLGTPNQIEVDGILGQQTLNALDWFRDTYKVPFTGPTLYKAVMSEYQNKRLNPTTPDLSDAAKQQENLARKNPLAT